MSRPPVPDRAEVTVVIVTIAWSQQRRPFLLMTARQLGTTTHATRARTHTRTPCTRSHTCDKHRKRLEDNGIKIILFFRSIVLYFSLMGTNIDVYKKEENLDLVHPNANKTLLWHLSLTILCVRRAEATPCKCAFKGRDAFRWDEELSFVRQFNFEAVAKNHSRGSFGKKADSPIGTLQLNSRPT